MTLFLLLVVITQDPFVMMALNGYLYGRGVTDNKGPIMAMIFALKEMKEQGILKGRSRAARREKGRRQ